MDAAASKTESLGFIRLCVKFSAVTVTEADQVASTNEKKQKTSTPNVWNSVLTVTLLEGSNLPAMDQNGQFLVTASLVAAPLVTASLVTASLVAAPLVTASLVTASLVTAH